MNWNGVMPAITTCFTDDLRVDHSFMAGHCRWLLDNGCTGVVTLGSLGEGATLSLEEKLDLRVELLFRLAVVRFRYSFGRSFVDRLHKNREA